MALAAGTRLGPYEIVAQIGAGGMGEVYRATDTNLGRQVAIKVLPDTVAQDPDRIARIEREAKTLAQLNHSNIAAIYGVEKSAGIYALVMELVEGPTLADRIAQGAIPIDEALPVAKQIAEALEAAHEQAIIHRDLKPANIKVKPDGMVKVLDFGLAKLAESGSGVRGSGSGGAHASMSPTITTPAMTQAGMILGTAAYMSPEQARGKPVDKRTDIWAFGCVLYEMLTARRAFEAEDVSLTLAEVMKSEPDMGALPAHTPSGVRTALRLCLHKNPRQRGGDIAAIRLALDGAFDTAPPPAAEPVASRRWWTRPLPVAGAALAAGMLVTMIVSAPRRSTPEAASVVRFDFEASNAPVGAPRNVFAFSPDGRAVVYVTENGLDLRPLDALESRVIEGTGGALTPVFSPDGQTVAYWANVAGELRRIAVGGGAPAVIATGIRPVSGMQWGSDDQLLYGQVDGIYRVPVDGGTPERVIEAEGGELLDGAELLPDGDGVLFSRRPPQVGDWDRAQIVVQSLATGERTVLVEGGSDARFVPPSHLVYAVGDGLFGVAFDPRARTVSGTPVPLVQGLSRSAYAAGANYGVSRDGTLSYLVGTPGGGLRTLAMVDRMGATQYLGVPPDRYLSPRLSPDGRRLAVQTTDLTGNSEIWTYDLAGASAIQRLTLEGNNYRPIWTPDGRRIAFASDREGTTSIYWQAADGSGLPERLTTAAEGTYHWPDSWSPDGTTLAFRMDSGVSGASNTTTNEMDVWTVSLEAGVPGEPRPFRATADMQEMGAAFSPDGRWLAYASGSAVGLQFRIYVEPFPATGERRLVSRELGIMPLWARDGTELFYRTVNFSGAAPQTLRKIGVSTDRGFAFTSEEPVAIGAFQSFAYYRSFDVAPDGKRFLLVLPQPGSDSKTSEPRINVVMNWVADLERLVPTP